MANDVTRSERQNGIVVTLKFRMEASSVSGWRTVKVRDLEIDTKSNKSLESLLDGPAISEHMSALLPFKFPASWKYDTISDSFVTTTPIMHV